MSETDPGPARKPHRPKRWFRIPIKVLTVAAIFLLAVHTALPWLAQTLLTPMVRDALQAPALEADIRRLSLTGMDMGVVSLGPDSGLRIAAVHADWTLSGLLRKRLDSVHILGLEAELRETASGWELPGLSVSSAKEDSSAPELPHIDTISVNGRVSLNGRALRLEAPFAVNGTLCGPKRMTLDVQTALAGQDILFSLDASPETRSFRLSGAIPGASVAALSSLVPGQLPLLDGVLSAQAGIAPSGGNASLTLNSIQTLVAGRHLIQENATTLHARWDGREVTARSAPLRLRQPWPVEIEIHDLRFRPDTGRGGCGWRVLLDRLPEAGLTDPVRVDGSLDVARENAALKADLSANLHAVRFSPSRDVNVILEPGVLNGTALIGNEDSHVEGVFRPGPLRLSRKSGAATLSGFVVNANASLNGHGGSGRLDFSGGRLDGKQESASFSVNPVSGNLRFDRDGTLRGEISAKARFKDKGVSGQADMRLPLAWPAPAGESGHVNCNLNWKGKDLARVSAQLKQNSRGLELDGTVSVTPANLRAVIRGQADFMEPAASWAELKAGQNITLPGNLARINPALGAITGTARLDATARIDLSQGAPRLPANLKLTRASMRHDQTKTVLDGGQVSLSFANALELRSDPEQRLTFDRLQLGGVNLEKGDIRFQMEGPNSFLVEGCALHWAGGRVGTHAFRINPSVEDYRVELYCDRVQLAQALEQFGMTQVRGGGTANGRIPLHYAGGLLSFDDGFLYSTPGEKGVLSIQGTEILTAGVPPDSPQYAQLDLAAEGLKDFSYEWAKIRMNTQDRELVISLELDGKPAKPLPFVYDRDVGGFARVSASSPGSSFQGIRLDANFRLPLDQLMQYRNILELMKKGG